MPVSSENVCVSFLSANATSVAETVLERIRVSLRVRMLVTVCTALPRVYVYVCAQNTFLERFALPGVSGLEEYNRYMEHLQDELEYQFQVCVCVCLFVAVCLSVSV